MAQAGTTVVIVEHRLEWMGRYADRVLVLAECEVVLDGTPADVLTSPLLRQIGVGWLRYIRAAHLGRTRGCGLTGGRSQRPWNRRSWAFSRRVRVHHRRNSSMQIHVEQVHFAYPKGVKSLNDVSVVIQPGEKVAQVRAQVEHALASLDLSPVSDLNPRDLGYAGRGRVALASALAMHTPVVDEVLADLGQERSMR
jgi:energy-coupling factor transporter ATP-binding protein EcfA2